MGEALYAAKILTSGDSIQSCKAMEQQSSSAWTKEESSLWSSKGDIEHSQSSDALDDSPVRKRIVSPTSQESNQLSFSPASTSTTESLHNSRRMISGPRATERSNSRRSRRTKALYPARGLGFNVASSRCSSRCTHSPPDSISDDAEFTPQKSACKTLFLINFFITDRGYHIRYRCSDSSHSTFVSHLICFRWCSSVSRCTPAVRAFESVRCILEKATLLSCHWCFKYQD